MAFWIFFALVDLFCLWRAWRNIQHPGDDWAGSVLASAFWLAAAIVFSGAALMGHFL